MAITAAMKKVLSPISDTNIIPHDFRKLAPKPPASRLVILCWRVVHLRACSRLASYRMVLFTQAVQGCAGLVWVLGGPASPRLNPGCDADDSKQCFADRQAGLDTEFGCLR